MASPASEPIVLPLDVHADPRGAFVETWNPAWLAERGIVAAFVQDNESRSRAGVIRGLHYQLPTPQGKLVRVVSGEIWDVVVDLRPGRVGRWTANRLSGERPSLLWIPAGFAHGFLALTDVIVQYKVDAPRVAEAERVIAWDDPHLALPWPLPGPPILSDRDRRGLALGDAPRF
jgi:dTDP-4-dehydrorhamnose 3,5-epimerase